MRVLSAGLSALVIATSVLLSPPQKALAEAPSVPQSAPQGAPCVSSTGPGIPPPNGFSAGLPGFHAQWYGQSGYPTLCPGATNTATVAYYNSGSQGWVANRMGEVAYLGTWGPEPGQDLASPLGGDGQLGSPNTSWPRYNRIAMQPSAYVGPGQVAWFQFTIKAPTTPGYYRLYLRPMIEGATWLEDYGVFWYIAVLNPDGTPPPQPASVYTPTGFSSVSVPTSRGTFTARVIKEPLNQVSVKTVSANATTCVDQCPVLPLLEHINAAPGGFAGINGTYLCPPDYASCAGKVNSYSYALFNSNLKTWISKPLLVTEDGLVIFNGSKPTYYRRGYLYGQNPALMSAPVTAGVAMSPLLIQNGVILDTSADQTDYQRLKGVKGALGTDNLYVYLVHVVNASLDDAAAVLKELGVHNALNMDGGGSSAMWAGGGYKDGPGRLLPNAIVLTRP